MVSATRASQRDGWLMAEFSWACNVQSLKRPKMAKMPMVWCCYALCAEKIRGPVYVSVSMLVPVPVPVG